MMQAEDDRWRRFLMYLLILMVTLTPVRLTVAMPASAEHPLCATESHTHHPAKPDLAHNNKYEQIAFSKDTCCNCCDGTCNCLTCDQTCQHARYASLVESFFITDQAQHGILHAHIELTLVSISSPPFETPPIS